MEAEDPKRRAFLGTMAAGGVALGSTGCTSAFGRMLGTLDLEAIEALLSRLDDGLDAVDAAPGLVQMLEQELGAGALDEVPAEERAEVERLSRNLFRAFMVTGMVHDLPVEERQSEELLQGLERFVPELEATLSEAAHLVASSPDDARQQLRQLLRDEPDLVMQVSETFDEAGGSFGLGRGGRAKLRQTFTYLSGRLRLQPPDLLIEECLERSERQLARHGVDLELWRQLTTEAPAHALWTEPMEGFPAVAKKPEQIETRQEQILTRNEQVTEAIDALDDDSLERRYEAIRTLGRLRASEAIEPLSQLLQNDPSPDLRGWALRALDEIGTTRARGAMTPALDDRDPRVRTLARELGVSPQLPPALIRQRRRAQRSLEEEQEDQQDDRGRTVVRGLGISTATIGGAGGLITLIGLLAGGLGSGGGGAAIMMTVGTVLMGIAVLLLIVTLIVYAVRRRRRRER